MTNKATSMVRVTFFAVVKALLIFAYFLFTESPGVISDFLSYIEPLDFILFFGIFFLFASIGYVESRYTTILASSLLGVFLLLLNPEYREHRGDFVIPVAFVLPFVFLFVFMAGVVGAAFREKREQKHLV